MIFGADVVQIEPPGGHPLRRRGPFHENQGDPERSLPWLAQNTSKRSITLDFESARGAEIFLALCETADAVIEARPPGALASLGLGYRELRARSPRLVLCSITPFGQSGPWRDRRGPDLSALATGGNLFPTGDPDRAPIRASLPTSYFHAGIEAAIGIVFAWTARATLGAGQHLDVSLQEVMLMPNMTNSAQYPITKARGRARRTRLSRRQGLSTRDLALQGRLRFLRAARRPGADSRTGRHGPIHARERYTSGPSSTR